MTRGLPHATNGNISSALHHETRYSTTSTLSSWAGDLLSLDIPQSAASLCFACLRCHMISDRPRLTVRRHLSHALVPMVHITAGDIHPVLAALT